MQRSVSKAGQGLSARAVKQPMTHLRKKEGQRMHAGMQMATGDKRYHWLIGMLFSSSHCCCFPHTHAGLPNC